MKGYVGNKEATRGVHDNEGFLKTGDIGYYDQDGTFFIVDRLKELIKYKASQVVNNIYKIIKLFFGTIFLSSNGFICTMKN